MSLDYLLAYACPATEPNAEGWTRFWIETHCMGFWITARKTEEGVWDDDVEDWTTPPRYEVHGWSMEGA